MTTLETKYLAATNVLADLDNTSIASSHAFLLGVCWVPGAITLLERRSPLCLLTPPYLPDSRCVATIALVREVLCTHRR
jgi:hypothetical protein